MFRRLTDRPIFTKILIANSIIILIGAIGGTYITRRLAQQSGMALTVSFFLVGVSITVLANYMVLRASFRPLVDLRSVMESMHKGVLRKRVPVDSSDPNLRAVSLAFNDMLERLDSESRNYSFKLLTSIEEERRRIARELHDETSQALAAVLINLELAEKTLSAHDDDHREAVRQRVVNSKQLIVHSLEQIKLLVYDLRPSMLDDLGLVPALRWYMETHIEGSGITVMADFEAASERLPGDVETALYRIAQEALANVVKHSGASQVAVTLVTRPHEAALTVVDDGKGFDPRNPRYRDGGYGLGYCLSRSAPSCSTAASRSSRRPARVHR